MDIDDGKGGGGKEGKRERGKRWKDWVKERIKSGIPQIADI